MQVFYSIIGAFLAALFRSRRKLVLENMALRQQLVIQQCSIKRPKINKSDRLFWIWLSRIWDNWKSALIIVKPETAVNWHRKGFKYYWTRKSRKVGRPAIDWPLIKLIRKLQRENPLWSAQRIQGELAKLGYSVRDNTVAKYMRNPKADPDQRQRWRTFLKNHAPHIAAMDFMVVRTIFFISLCDSIINLLQFLSPACPPVCGRKGVVPVADWQRSVDFRGA